jgi:hypothetical protein
MEEMRTGMQSSARPTERYAFEIYSDQKKKLNRIRYVYEADCLTQRLAQGKRDRRT